ncbi:MAG: hypothetical protein EZS28_039993, partial [Streblomastix strix]
MYLFESKEDSERNSFETPIRLRNICPGYADYDESVNKQIPAIDNYDTQLPAIKLKEIDFRVYVDLWLPALNDEESSTSTTVRKNITMCFLMNKSDRKYFFYKKKPGSGHVVFDSNGAENEVFNSVTVELKITMNNTGKRIYLSSGSGLLKISNEADPEQPMIIQFNSFSEYCMHEFMVCVADSTKDIPSGDNALFEITATAKKNGYKQNETAIKLRLHRHGSDSNLQTKQDVDNPFDYYNRQNKKDHDFFVIPRLNQDETQRAVLKRIQQYNNQIISRHEGVGDFHFVREDVLNAVLAGKQIAKSISIFRKTNIDIEKSGIKTALLHGFNAQDNPEHYEFGQTEGFTEFIAQSYNIKKLIADEIIFDRHFLFGEKENQVELKDVQGLENIYKKIVIMFREAILTEADRYVNFQCRWLARPRYNPNYKRGPLAVRSGMSIKVYNSEAGGSAIAIGTLGKNDYCAANSDLPVGTVIEFVKGKDIYDRDDSVVHRYQVAAIRLNGTINVPKPDDVSWYVPLTHANKKLCNDRIPQNFCNYIDMVEADKYNSKDKEALRFYSGHNGIPYYITDDEGFGKKDALGVFTERLMQSDSFLNWYSYP